MANRKVPKGKEIAIRFDLVTVRKIECGVYGRTCCWHIEAIGKDGKELIGNLAVKVKERFDAATVLGHNDEFCSEHERHGGAVWIEDAREEEFVDGKALVL